MIDLKSMLENDSKPEMKTTSIYIEVSTYEALRKLSEDTGRSVSVIVEKIIRDAMGLDRQTSSIQPGLFEE